MRRGGSYFLCWISSHCGLIRRWRITRRGVFACTACACTGTCRSLLPFGLPRLPPHDTVGDYLRLTCLRTGRAVCIRAKWTDRFYGQMDAFACTAPLRFWRKVHHRSVDADLTVTITPLPHAPACARCRLLLPADITYLPLIAAALLGPPLPLGWTCRRMVADGLRDRLPPRTLRAPSLYPVTH